MNKHITISFFFLLFFVVAGSAQQQIRFSLATDLGLQRSFKKEQRYFAVGQTVHGFWHFTPRGAAYAWISYYSLGRFRNALVATAKSPSTIPQQLNFTDSAEMRFKHISLGWKHYFRGAYDATKNMSLYGLAGFGLMLGRVYNTHSIPIDTSLYDVPVLNGKGNFKRLTLDMGLGWEAHLGGEIYFYNDVRVWIPTTDYPSKLIFVNENAPLVASLNFGVRIIF